MAKPVVFVDNDGVMADSISWWLEIHNFIHRTDYKKWQVTEWDVQACLGIDLRPYFTDYTKVQPIEHSMWAVSTLSEKYRIVFATAGYGERWLRMHFHDPEIVIIEDKSLLRGFALIDDRPLNLDGFQGQARFLLSQPWNQNRGLNDVDWPNIVQHLMSL